MAKQCLGCDGTGSEIKVDGTRGACHFCGGSGVDRDGCFPAGTPIETAHGRINIAEVRNGDRVLAYDLRSSAIREREVLAVHQYGQRRLWRVEFAQRGSIRTTGSHSFRTTSGWKRTCELKAGDEVVYLSESGVLQQQVVDCAAATGECAEVFNLIVEGDYCFIADGAVARSFTRFPRVQTLCWNTYGLLARTLAKRHFLKSAYVTG